MGLTILAHWSLDLISNWSSIGFEIDLQMSKSNLSWITSSHFPLYLTSLGYLELWANLLLFSPWNLRPMPRAKSIYPKSWPTNLFLLSSLYVSSNLRLRFTWLCGSWEENCGVPKSIQARLSFMAYARVYAKCHRKEGNKMICSKLRSSLGHCGCMVVRWLQLHSLAIVSRWQ